MFGKKSHTDLKKSFAKIRDYKKDPAVRAKHLKLILENVSSIEAKNIFESNFSHVYLAFFDLFLHAEHNLKQKVQKAHRDELEFSLWLFEKILTLLPELIHKQWQANSIKTVIRKLLNPKNCDKLRRQATFYFLLWYQALDTNASDDVHLIFRYGLVEDFCLDSTIDCLHAAQETAILAAVTTTAHVSNEKVATKDTAMTLFASLLEFMPSSVLYLQWHDKPNRQTSAFSFLFEQFKRSYIPILFPDFDWSTSVDVTNLELANEHRPHDEGHFHTYRISFIHWLVFYLHSSKKQLDSSSSSARSSLAQSETSRSSLFANRKSLSFLSKDEPHGVTGDSIGLDGNSLSERQTSSSNNQFAQLIQAALYSTIENINFIFEVFRQTFLLNFSNSLIIRKVINFYRDLIQDNFADIPWFYRDSKSTTQPPNIHFAFKLGSQNILQVFLVHSSNLFLCDISSGGQNAQILEEQNDCCKKVLNVYRYIVMHIKMELSTWEKILQVLLQITAAVVSERPPNNRNATLAGKLAPALFQTLIVTWVKASLNICIQKKLWDRFLDVLYSLTFWEELIDEWTKTMDTLTRILARHVYKLDINNLPLDRINEQRWKRSRHLVADSSKKNTETKFADKKEVETQSISALTPTTEKLAKLTLIRSKSETNILVAKKNDQKTNQIRFQEHVQSESEEKTSAAKDRMVIGRTKSLSFLPLNRQRSHSLESVVASSPTQLDHFESFESATTDHGNRSLLCGGSLSGWSADAALVLWKRMLAALGNINRIQDPQLHAKVFEYLVTLTDQLVKLKRNLGIGDNMSVVELPEFTPPLTEIVPWCFEALQSLNAHFERGQTKALQLLCTIVTNCEPEFRTFLPELYHVLHKGLCGSSRITIECILKHLGAKFLSLQLPGYSLLLLDLIHACNYVLNTSDLSSNSPRIESISMLCGLLSLSDSMRNLSMFQPNAIEFNVITCSDFKEHVIDILLKVSKKERHLQSRCIAVNSLGIFVLRELKKEQPNSRVKDALSIINWTLKIKNRKILQACANVLALIDSSIVKLQKLFPAQFFQLLISICHTISSLPITSLNKTLQINLMHCLTEWCMQIGPRVLLNQSFEMPLLLHVFKVFDQLINFQLSIFSDVLFPDDFDTEIVSEMSDNDFRLDSYSEPDADDSCRREIALLAQHFSAHLVTHLGHFPMTSNVAQLTSSVIEQDDLFTETTSSESPGDNDLQWPAIFNARNIQMLIINQQMLASFIELPTFSLPLSGGEMMLAEKQARVLIRNLGGKFCWDALLLSATTNPNTAAELKWNANAMPQPKTDIVCTSQSHTLRQRPVSVLPTVENRAHDLDQLNDLLRYLSHTSPEVLQNIDRALNEIDSMPSFDTNLENETIAIILNQENALKQYLKEQRMGVLATTATITASASSTNDGASNKNSFGSFGSDDLVSSSQDGDDTSSLNAPVSPAFHYCGLLISQLGLCNWSRRGQVQLFNKNERLIRELRNLDNQCCRETHKVAVIFVDVGQEDKLSILSNKCGSEAFEEFVAGLAWEVELEHHTGFTGGLKKQGSAGTSTPYYATSLVEVVFHVSTRMPSDSNDAILNKTRHLGNDEIHIVWSEHSREYRRDVIPTEFCDILIVIYPLGKRYNRITISTKSDIGYFGPIFNELLVENELLPFLVRSTILFASRSKRSTLPFYKQYFEERTDAIKMIANECKELSTFEEFVSKIYAPVFPVVSATVTRGPGSYSLSLDSQSTSSTASSAYFIDHHHHYQQQQHQQQQLHQQHSMLSRQSSEHSTTFNTITAPDQSSSSISPIIFRKNSKTFISQSPNFNQR